MSEAIVKVLISDDIDDECLNILKSNGIEAVKQTKLTRDQLKTEIAQYDGLIVRSATKVTADVIEAGCRLKVIGRAGTGVDNVDVEAATRRGIVVMNTPGGNTLSATEHTCAMLLAVARHVSRGTACVRDGQWDQKKFLVGTELYGKTLAIIGLGRIGREVADRMRSFGMKTVGFDPLVCPEESRRFGVESLSLDDLWPAADFITLHTPLIPQTKHLINAATLAKCRKGVRIVNCARGGIINEDDLLAALESGHCAGVGLDVFEQEPPTNVVLLQHPLVTSTPHLGASTVEAQSRVAVEIAQQFVDMARKTALTGAINADALKLTMNAETRPWLMLAGCLARLGRELLIEPLTAKSSVSISTRGDLLKSTASSLVAASLMELITSSAAELPLNLISAPAAGRAVGITVLTAHEVDNNTSSPSITLKLDVGLNSMTSSTASVDRKVKTVVLDGTVLDGQPHWTAVDGLQFWQPVELVGSLLVGRCLVGPKSTGIMDTIQNKACSDTLKAIVSLTSTVLTTDHQIAWCSIRVSHPVEQSAEFASINY